MRSLGLVTRGPGLGRRNPISRTRKQGCPDGKVKGSKTPDLQALYRKKPTKRPPRTSVKVGVTSGKGLGGNFEVAERLLSDGIRQTIHGEGRGRRMERGMGLWTAEGPAERLGSFLDEVGRRRVWRTALGYAAVAFVLLQVGEIVFPAFGAPDWALRVLVMASFLGFPVTLALAWAFDLTPDGIQKTESGEGSGLGDAYSGTTLPRLAFLAVTLAIVGGLGWWSVQDAVEASGTSRLAPSTGIPASSLLDEAPLQVRSLAVLPLEDFSEGEGGEYFTAGLHEELVSQLSQIGAARVVSRTTVVEYDRSGKTMPVLARELGVEGVVEGSVFRDGNRVRITVQLIHGPTDQHLWANSYEGTLEDAIALQRTVAQAIAKEIRAELFPEEESGIPTTRVAASPDAQEEYLRGRFEQSKGTPEALASAVEHYEAAVAEDSGFAPAYAGMAAARLLQRARSLEKPQAGVEVDAGAQPRPAVVVDTGVVSPLKKALRFDGESPEAQALLLTLNAALGELPEEVLKEGLYIFQDSAALLRAEVDLVSTEFGRQLQDALSPRASHSGFRFRDHGLRHAEAEGEEYWEERVTELEEKLARGEAISRVELARAFVGMQQFDKAIVQLGKAVSKRDRDLVSLWTDPAWDALRADPGFQEILSEIRRHRGRGEFLPR
jgi:TolB-like protein